MSEGRDHSLPQTPAVYLVDQLSQAVHQVPR